MSFSGWRSFSLADSSAMKRMEAGPQLPTCLPIMMMRRLGSLATKSRLLSTCNSNQGCCLWSDRSLGRHFH